MITETITGTVSKTDARILMDPTVNISDEQFKTMLEPSSRKLATIRKIDNLEPIEGADKIEHATIDGWKVVVKKDEFKVGDKCVYWEIDSLLDETNPHFSFLVKNGKIGRLKTIRLRGAISQGLALKLECLKQYFPQPTQDGQQWLIEHPIFGKCTWPIQLSNELKSLQGIDAHAEICNVLMHEIPLGIDVTEFTKTTKYEPPEIGSLSSGGAKGNFPHFLRKTDQERVQNCKNIFSEIGDEDVVITLKLDGTSATFYLKDGVYGVCSRNIDFKLDCPSNADNTYINIGKKYQIEEALKNIGRNLAIQGEIFGTGIQGNKLKYTEKAFMVFDIYDIDKQQYMDQEELVNILHQLNNSLKREDYVSYYSIKQVPILYQGKLPFTNIEGGLKYADGVTYDIDPAVKTDNGPGEGVVIKTVKNKYSNILRGRTSFKIISNKYLEKYGL